MEHIRYICNMRDTNHTPVKARFNMDIAMPHVHMTQPEMVAMGLDPDDCGMTMTDDMQICYFGNTMAAFYEPSDNCYWLTLDRSVMQFKSGEEWRMCNMIQTFLESEKMLLDHMHRFTWTWANVVANNIDADRFWNEVKFLFEGDGNVIDNMAGEGDDMFQFHVNEYQVFGLRTPEDDYRVIRWVDGDAVVVGHYPTLFAVKKAIDTNKAEVRAQMAMEAHTANVIAQVQATIANRARKN